MWEISNMLTICTTICYYLNIKDTQAAQEHNRSLVYKYWLDLNLASVRCHLPHPLLQESSWKLLDLPAITTIITTVQWVPTPNCQKNGLERAEACKSLLIDTSVHELWKFDDEFQALTERNRLFVKLQSSTLRPSTIQLSQTSNVWFTNTSSNFLLACSTNTFPSQISPHHTLTAANLQK